MRIAGRERGNHIISPERSRPSAARQESQNCSFCPPLYFPTFESSVSQRMYCMARPPLTHSLRSDFFRRMSEDHAMNMTTVEIMKATPNHGWRTRHTDKPPKKVAIQPKTGVQIGMPVKTQMKNVSATVQWIN